MKDNLINDEECNPYKAEFLKKLSDSLGRKVSPAEEGSIISFKHITESDLNEFDLITESDGIIAAAWYIRFKVKKSNSTLMLIKEFCDKVINDREPYKTWLDRYANDLPE